MEITSEIYEEYKGLVYHLYSKLEKTHFVKSYREDILQEGFLGLCKAVNTYDESYTTSLSTYIYHCVKYSMYNYIKSNGNSQGLVFDDTIQLRGREAVDFEYFPSTEELINELLADYKYYLKNYKNKNVLIDTRICRAQIILNEYMKSVNVTTRDIEEKYCISRTHVSNVLKDLRTVIMLKQNNMLYIKEK